MTPLVLFLVAAAPRILVVPADGAHDAALEAALSEAAHKAGLDVAADAADAGCDKEKPDCLLRLAALNVVDGAVSWRKSKDGLELVVASVSSRTSSNRWLAEDATPPEVADAAAQVIATVFPAAPLPPETTPPPPTEPPPTEPPPAPPVDPPVAVDDPGPPLGLTLAGAGAAVVVAGVVVAAATDTILAGQLESAAAHDAKVPDSYGATEALFYTGVGAAAVGVVVAGVGGVLLLQ